MDQLKDVPLRTIVVPRRHVFWSLDTTSPLAEYTLPGKREDRGLSRSGDLVKSLWSSGKVARPSYAGLCPHSRGLSPEVSRVKAGSKRWPSKSGRVII